MFDEEKIEMKYLRAWDLGGGLFEKFMIFLNFNRAFKIYKKYEKIQTLVLDSRFQVVDFNF